MVWYMIFMWLNMRFFRILRWNHLIFIIKRTFKILKSRGKSRYFLEQRIHSLVYRLIWDIFSIVQYITCLLGIIIFCINNIRKIVSWVFLVNYFFIHWNFRKIFIIITIYICLSRALELCFLLSVWIYFGYFILFGIYVASSSSKWHKLTENFVLFSFREILLLGW